MFTHDMPSTREDALDIIRDAVDHAGWEDEGSDAQVVRLLARIAPSLKYLSEEYTRIPDEHRTAILSDLD